MKYELAYRLNNNFYKDWLNSEIEEYHRSTSSSVEYSDYINSSCWFITATFDRDHIYRRLHSLGWSHQDTRLHFEDFDFLYRRIALSLNPTKVSGQYPFAVVSIDFEGSRGISPSLSRVRNNAHWHAIICVPHSQAMQARRYLNGPRLRLLDKPRTSIDSLNIVQYDPLRDKDHTLTTYVTKAFVKSTFDPSSVDGLWLYRGHEANFNLNKERPKKSKTRENRHFAKMKRATSFTPRNLQYSDPHPTDTDNDELALDDADFSRFENDADPGL